VLRLADNGAHGPELDEAARVHHSDAIGDLDRDTHIVGDKQDGHAQLALETSQKLENLDLHRRIERRGRLVGEEQARLAGESKRDHGPLAHAARHFVRVIVEAPCRRGDLHQFEQLERTLPGIAVRESIVSLQGLDDLGADREDRVEGGYRSWKIIATSAPRRSSRER
jgi:RecB family endonuclease NucS